VLVPRQTTTAPLTFFDRYTFPRSDSSNISISTRCPCSCGEFAVTITSECLAAKFQILKVSWPSLQYYGVDELTILHCQLIRQQTTTVDHLLGFGFRSAGSWNFTAWTTDKTSSKQASSELGRVIIAYAWMVLTRSSTPDKEPTSTNSCSRA
jgi:hypothetical protein